MPVKNKKQYLIYLDEESTEFVNDFLKTTRNTGGLSALVNAHIKTLAVTLRAAGYKPGKKMSAAQLIKIAVKGLAQEPM